MKCNECNTELPESAFYKNDKTACKECRKSNQKAMRESLNSHNIRQCTKCFAMKDRSEFYSGCRYCKSCQNEITNGHRDKRKANDAAGVPRKCAVCKKEKSGQAAFGTGGATYCLGCSSKKRRVDKYSLSSGQIASVESSTNCSICKRQFRSKRDKHVDHCHASGAIRGILCSSCNTAIGKMQDSVVLLQSAISYLTNPPGIQ